MGSYTQQQVLVPIVINLGANVAIGTTESWPVLTVPSYVPTMQLVAATLSSGTTVALNATDFNVWTIRNGSTVMATLNGGATNLAADVPTAFTLNATLASRRADPTNTITINKDPTLNGTAGTPTIQAMVTLFFREGSDDLLGG
jgi:hypothetical protein